MVKQLPAFQRMDSMKRLHHFAGAVLRRLQGLTIYRRIGRRVASDVAVREANDADQIAVQRWLDPNGNPSHGIQHDLNVTSWVAVYRGHLAGFVQLVRHPPDHAPYVGHWLFSLTIKSLWRGLGIGEALSQAVIDRAREEAAPVLDLLVNEDNVRAVRLYRKLGFEAHTVAELGPQLESELASTGRRRVVMRKRLADHGSRNS
jgi:ribosomal protein S18 acetylase RimI-like enzyme